MLDSTAARHLHADDLDTFYVVIFDYCRQLFGIINRIKLGATYKRYVVADEIVMEVTVSIRCTVGGYKQVCSVKIRCVDGNKFYLTRPLLKLTLNGHRLCCRRTAGTAEGLHIGAGTSAGELYSVLLHFGLTDGLLIVSGRLTLLKGDGICGASGQAIAQAVAIVLTCEPGLAANYFYCFLVAGGGASTAAVAFIFINLYDLSFHSFLLLKAFARAAIPGLGAFKTQLVGTLSVFKDIDDIVDRGFGDVFQRFIGQKCLVRRYYYVGH